MIQAGKPGTPPIDAIVLDLDGTLYSYGQVRVRMLGELARAFLHAPRQQIRVTRFLQAYRRAQEVLREFEASEAGMQLSLACRWTGVDREWGRLVIQEWMDQRPLRFLAAARRPGVTTFLAGARRRGIKVGLCSDYPAEGKLSALGIQEAFDAVISAQDPSVNRFKPNPTGLLTTLSLLKIPPERAVYIGDRPDVDGEAARRAGVRGYILSRSPGTPSNGWTGIRDFIELGRQLGVHQP